jgi:hypothetical protein
VSDQQQQEDDWMDDAKRRVSGGDQQQMNGADGQPKAATRGSALIQTSGQFVAGFVPPDYLIEGVIQRRFAYALTGKTGSGKTAIVLLFATSVALGRPVGGLEVAQGRVLYFCGENPDDVRMRWIAMSKEFGFDVDDIAVHFIPGRFKIADFRKRILQELQTIGDIVLVVIDTSAAYFPGDDPNNNAQMIAHAQTLRTLVDLPGGPAVLINCHPVKNATRDNLLPYGGGGFVNELDGNLTVWKEDMIELSWQGKFRGPDFAPLSFKVQTVTHDRLKDSKGRPLWTVVASYLSETEQQQIAQVERSNEDKLLFAIKTNGKASLADFARMCEWTLKSGEPNKMLVKRTAEKLLKIKLIARERGEYQITDKGGKVISKVEEAEREAARPDSKTTMGSKRKKAGAKAAIEVKQVGPTPAGATCIYCQQETDQAVGMFKNAAAIGSKPETLHQGCAPYFFENVRSGKPTVPMSDAMSDEGPF